MPVRNYGARLAGRRPIGHALAMRRFGAVIGLRPEHRETYLRLHREVWPAVEARLTASHFTNYTIFRRGDLLFAYYEYTGDDYAADAAAIATREWWELTDPCQQRLEGTPEGEQWAPMDEIWHLD
jgi:L-rhamnose mutarotase